MRKLFTIRNKAALLKQEALVLLLALRHPATPLFVKAFVALIVGYALSPIDLIPDFVPILGYIDDLILLPLGITLALRMLPAPVLAECRSGAALLRGRLPRLWLAAGVIVLVWLAAVYFIIRALLT